MSRFGSLAALIAVIAAPGCRSGGGGSSSGVVPWLDRPVARYVAPQPKRIPYETGAPPCRAGLLSVTQGRSAVGAGNELEQLVFTNRGARACLLRGYPRITGVTPAGRRVALRPMMQGTYFEQLVPADLRPGGHVFLDLATSKGCDGGVRAGTRYRDLRFVLPLGGIVRGGRASIVQVCGLSMSWFGLPARYSDMRPNPGTMGTLRASLEAPKTVRAGVVLRFVVSLRNDTRRAVTLRPCPGYTENLVAPGLTIARAYALNCGSVHSIPAGERVRYAMELPVPRKAPAGFAKLAWSLHTPTGPAVGGSIEIVP